MPDLGFSIRCAGVVPGVTLVDKSLSEVLTQSWYEPGRNWAANLRPKHFTKAGGKEYGYEPRAGESGNERDSFWSSYTGQKQKRFGHTLPLVFSGDLANKSTINRVESSASGVRVILTGANKANFHNPNSHINMRDELTRISQGEAIQSTEILEDALITRLDRFDVTVTLFGQSATPTTSVAGFFHGE
jgi:hypothetical protein